MSGTVIAGIGIVPLRSGSECIEALDQLDHRSVAEEAGYELAMHRLMMRQSPASGPARSLLLRIARACSSIRIRASTAKVDRCPPDPV
jgi:hypothetical protein